MGEDVGGRFSKQALETRSEAYRWLWTNRAQIAPVLMRHARRPWRALAKTAADDGKTFTPDALRLAWRRIERDLARDGTQPPSPVSKPSQAKPDETSASPTRPTSDEVPDDEEEIEITMGDGTPRKVRIPKQQ